MTAHIIIDDITPLIGYTVGASPHSVFPVPFAFFATSDLVVRVGGIATVLSTDYAVTGTAVDAGFSSGTVTLNTAVMNTTVVIGRVLPIERVTDFPNSGPLDMPALNTQFDKIIAILQQQQESLDEVTPLTPRLVGGHLVFDMPDGSVLDLGSVLGPEGPAGAAQNFDSDDILAASTVADGINRVSVAGRSTAGDGGDADRFYVASDVNPAPTDVVTSDVPPKRFRLLERVLRPGHFGITTASADNRQGFADLAAEIQWRGGGRFELDDCKSYAIYDTPPANGSILMRFDDINGLTIGFNGSKIITAGDFYPNQLTLTTIAGSTTATVSSATGLAIGTILNGPNLIAVTSIVNIVGTTLTLDFAAARTGTALHYYRATSSDALGFYGFVLTNSHNIVLKHPWFEHTHPDFSTTLDPHSGLSGMSIGESCSDIDILGTWRQIGGRIAVEVVRSNTWSVAARSHNMRLATDTDYSFYGCFLERNGDNVEIVARSHHVGRTAGCYGVSGVKFDIDSRAGDAYDDFLITSLASPLDSQRASATTGIRANYRWRADPTNLTAKGTLFDIGFRQGDAGAPRNCMISDVKVKLDFDASAVVTATHPGAAITTIGAAAPAVGKHYLIDVSIGGSIFNLTGTSAAARLFTDTDWTAVQRRAFRLDGLSIVSSALCDVNIDGRGLDAGSVDLQTVRSDQPLVQTNVTAGTLVGRNSFFSNATF